MSIDIPSVGQYTNGRIANRNAQLPLTSDNGMEYMTLSELKQFVFEGYTPEGLAQLTELTELINELQQASDQIAEQLTEKANSITVNQLRTDLETTSGELAALQDGMTDDTETISQLQTGVTENANSISQLQQTVTENNSSIDQLQTQVALNSNSIDELQQLSVTHGNVIEQVQADVQSTVTSIDELTDKDTQHTNAIDQLQIDLNTYMDAIDTLQSSAGTTDTLQSSVTANTNAITTANQNIATLTKQMNREIALDYRPITAVAPYNFIHTTSPTDTWSAPSVLSGRIRLSIIKIPKDIAVDRFLSRVKIGLPTVNTHLVLYALSDGNFAGKLWAYSPLIGFPTNGNVLNVVQMTPFANQTNAANGLPADAIPAGTYWIGVYAKTSDSANFTFYTAVQASEYGLTSLGSSQTVSGLEYLVGVAEVPPELTTLVPGQISLGAIKMGFRVTEVLS